MPFYKVEDNKITSATHIDGSGFSLSETSKDEYTYPVSDWYWFVDLEAAEQGLSSQLIEALTETEKQEYEEFKAWKAAKGE